MDVTAKERSTERHVSTSDSTIPSATKAPNVRTIGTGEATSTANPIAEAPAEPRGSAPVRWKWQRDRSRDACEHGQDSDRGDRQRRPEDRHHAEGEGDRGDSRRQRNEKDSREACCERDGRRQDYECGDEEDQQGVGDVFLDTQCGDRLARDHVAGALQPKARAR